MNWLFSEILFIQYSITFALHRTQCALRHMCWVFKNKFDWPRFYASAMHHWSDQSGHCICRETYTHWERSSNPHEKSTVQDAWKNMVLPKPDAPLEEGSMVYDIQSQNRKDWAIPAIINHTSQSHAYTILTSQQTLWPGTKVARDKKIAGMRRLI